jgi:hypothetical protein
MARQGRREQGRPPAFIQWDPMFDKLHHDPRWLAFLGKIGKTQEQLEKLRFELVVPKCGSSE